MRNFVIASAAALGLAALSGCASDANKYSDEPGFQAGYGDGCITATEEDKSFSTRTARDADAFESDPAYRAGWRQGYTQCGSQRSANDGGRILGERDDN